jgi:hypothetical protein
MGFLAVPNIVWRPGLILGLAYVLGSAFAFYTLTYAALRRWLPTLASVVAVAALAVPIVHLPVTVAPELAALATMLWSWELLQPEHLAERLSPWVAAALGTLAGLQLLVKFSVGLVGFGVALLVVLTHPQRVRNIALGLGAAVAAVVVLFLTLQQSLSDFPTWFSRATQLSAGYSAAMSIDHGFSDTGFLSGTKSWLLLLPAAAIAIVGAVVYARSRRRPVAALLLLAGTGWIMLKEGFVRLDAGHAAITFIAIAVIVATLPWPARLRAAGVAGIAVAAFGLFATSYTSPSGVLQRVRDILETPVDNAKETARALRSVVDSGYRDQRLIAAQRGMEAEYAVPAHIIAALRGHGVLADPWEISAIWAYQLRWHPAPVFQTYSAYTDALDTVNRDAISGKRLSVLHHRHVSIDGRFPAWESPSYMTELACSYSVAVSSRDWQALAPTRDHCRAPLSLGTAKVSGGESIAVPAPRDPRSIVVARFDLPESLLERVATFVLKPLQSPYAVLDDNAYRFIPGTQHELHLLSVPETIVGSRPANGGLDIQHLGFRNTEGSVTVRFYELPTG